MTIDITRAALGGPDVLSNRAYRGFTLRYCPCFADAGFGFAAIVAFGLQKSGEAATMSGKGLLSSGTKRLM